MDALPGPVPGSGVAMDNNRPDPDTGVCVVYIIPAHAGMMECFSRALE